MLLIFQSTHPRRVRLDAAHAMAEEARAISIHAPTQGATLSGWHGLIMTLYFNPRTHAGCDKLGIIKAVAETLFQSTHPRRVRLAAALQGWYCLFDFNPRTHAGCDFGQLRGQADAEDFNPRTHAGCDTTVCTSCGVLQYFNPRTHAGCDDTIQYQDEAIYEFQSTHPRRVRLVGGLLLMVKA